MAADPTHDEGEEEEVMGFEVGGDIGCGGDGIGGFEPEESEVVELGDVED